METTDSQFDQIKQIVIVGTGLLGGSIGLGLKKTGFKGRLIGLGRSKATLEKALKRGCVDDVTDTLRPNVRDSQLLILCSPVTTFEDWFTRLKSECHDGLVITDVGSTKTQVCSQARAILGKNATRFVGSHPMAGGEMSGPEQATADLFHKKPCIITPMGDTSADAVNVVESLWKKLGMRVVRMLPRDHDITVARISHLPHAVAAAMVLIADRLGGLDIASTGFRDTTRVASGDPDLWVDIFLSNKDAIGQAIDSYAEEVAALRAVIAKGDRKKLRELLARAQQARDAWLQTAGLPRGDAKAAEH